MSKLGKRTMLWAILALVASGVPAQSITLRLGFGPSSATEVRSGVDLEHSLQGTNLDRIQDLTIIAGQVVTTDWVWLYKQRDRLAHLLHFSIAPEVHPLANIPNLAELQHQTYGSRKRLLDSNRTLFPQGLERFIAPRIQRIGSHIFFGSGSLREVRIDSAEQLGDFVFTHCTELREVSGPKLHTMGEGTFMGCVQLRQAEHPRLIELGANAFYGCTSLEGVDLPEVEELDEGTFAYCSQLKTARFASADWIGLWSFAHCISLREVHCPEAKVLVVGAFQGCSALEEACFPLAEGVGNWAFDSCTSLRRLGLPRAQRLGLNSFGNCTSLEVLGLGPVVPTIHPPEHVIRPTHREITANLCANCPTSRRIVGMEGETFLQTPPQLQGKNPYTRSPGFSKGRWYGWIVE